MHAWLLRALRVLDRKPFQWRELRSVLTSNIQQLPRDGSVVDEPSKSQEAWMAETVMAASRKITSSLVPVATGGELLGSRMASACEVPWYLQPCCCTCC